MSEIVLRICEGIASLGLAVCLAIILALGLRNLFKAYFKKGLAVGLGLVLLFIVTTHVGGTKSSGTDREDGMQRMSSYSVTDEDLEAAHNEDRDRPYISGMEMQPDGVRLCVSGSSNVRYADNTLHLMGSDSLTTNECKILTSIPYEPEDGSVEVLIPYRSLQGDARPDAFFFWLQGEEDTRDDMQDSDGDGLADYLELEFGSNPQVTDSDGDGLSDFEEWRIGGDPNIIETLEDLHLGLEPAPSPVTVSGDVAWPADDPSGGDIVGTHTANVSYGADSASVGLSVYGVAWPGGMGMPVDLAASVSDHGTDSAFTASVSGASFVPRATGRYAFQLAVDDRATLTIGDVLSVSAEWSRTNSDGEGPVEHAILVEGVAYPVSLTWTNLGGPGNISFPVWGEFSSIERPTLTSGFSARKVVCSRSKRASNPKRRIRNGELTDFNISVTGGALGGTLFAAFANGDKVAHVAEDLIPVSCEIAPFETRELKGVYRGTLPTAPDDDVLLSVRFVEARTGRELVQTSRLTVVEPEFVQLEVERIRFDHAPNDGFADAVAIRKNRGEAFDITKGEWAKYGAVNLPMCYLSSGRVTVKARLDLGVGIDTNLIIFAEADGFAFGGLKPQSVVFTDGYSGVVEFKASTRIQDNIDLGTGSITWKIEGSTISKTTGPHRYYIVFDDPLEPWSTTSGSNQNLWTDVLDVACREAKGDADPAAALAHLTTALFNYGYTYDSMEGASHFSSSSEGYVDLTGYLRKEASSQVNCYDQAYVLSAFGKSLGIDAKIMLRQPIGYIRLVSLVGGVSANNPFYNKTGTYCGNAECSGNDHAETVRRSSFARHLYVTCGNKVFDACIGPEIGRKSETEYMSALIETPDNSLNVATQYYQRGDNYELR